jgi:hypothetical protein
MPLVNFQKKNWFFSFIFCQNFDVRTFSRWLRIRGTKFFWWAIKNFFKLNFHSGPIRWVFRWFFKILIIYSQNLHFYLVYWVIFEKKLYHAHAEHTWKQFCTLSIREKNFPACSASGKMWTVFTCHPCWAYAERILSHIEHMRKCLKVEYKGFGF